ncbi:MAG TPA: hypothetical protein VIQ54_09555, partial [Polyangia bacterium]
MRTRLLAASCILGAAIAASLGCTAKVTPSAAGAAGATGSAGTGAGTGRGGSGTAGTSGSAGTGGGPIIGTDAGSDAACAPSVTCTPAGGQYCGKIGNGCKGGSLECG